MKKHECWYCHKHKKYKMFSVYNKDLENGELYCCDGRECGCHGLPIEPPICNMCIFKNKVKMLFNKLTGD